MFDEADEKYKYSENEIIDICLNNAVRMLKDRGVLESKFTPNIKNNAIKTHNLLIKYYSTIPKRDEHQDELNNVKTHKVLICHSNKLKNTLQQYHNTEVFNEEFLMTIIVDHVLQPKFTKIDNNEQFLKDFLLEKNKLPILKKDDPITLYYNYKEGDIIRIERNSLVSPSVGYRIVR